MGHWHKGFPFSDTTHVAPQEQYVFSQGSEKKMRFTRRAGCRGDGERGDSYRSIFILIQYIRNTTVEKKVVGENGREIKFIQDYFMQFASYNFINRLIKSDSEISNLDEIYNRIIKKNMEKIQIARIKGFVLIFIAIVIFFFLKRVNRFDKYKD